MNAGCLNRQFLVGTLAYTFFIINSYRAEKIIFGPIMSLFMDTEAVKLKPVFTGLKCQTICSVM
jgi:hypothetical protein